MNGMTKQKRHFSGGRNFGQNRHNNRHKNNNNSGMHHHNIDDDFVHPRMRRPLQTQKDRYVALARDALSSGDRILAEYYYQYVEHFSRMINLIPQPQQQPTRRPHDEQGEGVVDGSEEPMASDAAPAEQEDADVVPEAHFASGPSSYYARSAAPAAPSAAASVPSMPIEENE